MSKKIITSGVIALVVIFALVAGYYWSQDTLPEPVTPSYGTFKVAMLFPGPVDDGGWNQAGYEGLLLIEKEMGAQVAYTENVQDPEPILRQFSQQGFDFIIAHAVGFTTSAEVVAEKFPRIKFAVVSGYAGNNKNLGALAFRAGEMGYLCGVVAALKTKTNKIAYIGGMAFPILKEHSALYERGARAINPKIEVAIEWVGAWDDPDKARSIAEKLIEERHDVLLANVDLASLAIFEAAKEAGVYAIAIAKDQHDFAPETILTSNILKVSKLLLKGAILVRQGRWEGMQYKFGMLDEVQELAPFYGLLTAEEEAIVQAIQKDILSDEVDVSL